MTTRLTVLDGLRIASPCRADWDEMSGDERVRFCGQCEKNVYNLSAMSRAEAEALVLEKEGRLCVRFYQREDGTVLTSDCPVGERKKRIRQRVWASVSSVAASAALLFGLWSGRARADASIADGKSGSHPRVTVQGGAVAMPLMGDVAVIPAKPKKKKPQPPPCMGEPMPLVGKVAVPTHKK